MDTPSMRDRALEYVSGFGWPVFPVRRWDKKPMVRDWPHEATTDPFTVWAWWTRWPEANIGMPTGLFYDVVDVDSMAALVALEDVCTRIGHAHRGPISKTGRGWQMFYKPTGLRNRKPALEGVDFRGSGGFVILPGSRHKNGAVYTWLRTGPAYPMPAELQTALWPPRDIPPVRSRPPEAPKDPSRDEAWARRGLEAIKDELGRVPRGHGIRNHELNRLSFRGWQLAHLLSEEEVEAALLEGAEANGYLQDHGMTRTLSTIHSAKAGMGHPRFPGGQP